MPTERRNRLMQGLMTLLPRPGNWRDWRQGLDMATNSVIPGDWYNSETRRWNNPLQAFGLDELFGGGRPPTSPLPTYLDPATAGPQPPPAPWSAATVPGEMPQGQGPLMSHQRPRPRNIRPGGGQVIAEGQAAQDMVEGMRESTNEQLNRQARELDRRMWRGQEK